MDTATEAGLELNKMVTDLLSNQSGSDSIISSVEDMQRQLNEQEGTIFFFLICIVFKLSSFFYKATTVSINALLAEKSRENSELQIKLSEISSKYETELDELMKQNETLDSEYTQLKKDYDEQKLQLDITINKEVTAKVTQLEALKKELKEIQKQYDEIRLANQTSESRVQTLEDLLKQLKKGGSADELDALMDVANLKSTIIALTKEKDRLADKLDGELDARKLLEDHVRVVSEEVSTLRQGFNLAEKDKLEAQTRLEVLSTYFKEKETQLQK